VLYLHNQNHMLVYFKLVVSIELIYFFMISFFRSAQQMRRLFLLPGSTLNKYYFSSTAPFNSGTSPSSSSPTKQSSGSTSQPKGKSSSPEELSEVAQKAIWASAVINHIINSTPPKSIQKSLRDEIL